MSVEPNGVDQPGEVDVVVAVAADELDAGVRNLVRVGDGQRVDSIGTEDDDAVAGGQRHAADDAAVRSSANVAVHDFERESFIDAGPYGHFQIAAVKHEQNVIGVQTADVRDPGLNSAAAEVRNDRAFRKPGEVAADRTVAGIHGKDELVTG